MSGIIQLLPPNISNQIAAGEVVQRPSSVVKELIENAIDAKATHIQLIIKDAGRTLIQIIDNGSGMTSDDALLAFERHATSKIRTSEDLFNLQTMGFRGEALASIAAIAHVEMKTKKENDELGTLIEMEGNVCRLNSPTACDKGTSIAVKNLFFNVPARRNFLKSDNVENNHIVDEFVRTALIHNDIAFTYYNNGKLIHKLEKANFKKRIIDIFGNSFNNRLLPIEETVNLVKITGFITKAEYAKKNKGEQFFFVNNRFMKHPYFANAVDRAYQNLVPEKTYPSFFIHLEVDPRNIDVNIHPTKTEIKFLDEKIIYAVLYAAAKKSLGQFTLAAQLDFDADKSIDFNPPALKPGQIPSQPKVEFNPEFNPFEQKWREEKPITTREKSNNENWQSFYEVKPKLQEEIIIKQEDIVINNNFEENKNLDVISVIDEDPKIENKKTDPVQIQGKYILASTKTGLIIINQERASQRVLFEKFSVSNYESISSQQLLFPFNHFFSPTQSFQLLELLPDIRKYGFMLEYQKDGSFNIVGIPNTLNSENAQLVIEELLHELSESNIDTSTPKHYKIALSMSKRLCIKEGDKLITEEMIGLIGQLFACQSCDISPFGKKIIHKLNIEELDKFFE